MRGTFESVERFRIVSQHSQQSPLFALNIAYCCLPMFYLGCSLHQPASHLAFEIFTIYKRAHTGRSLHGRRRLWISRQIDQLQNKLFIPLM